MAIKIAGFGWKRDLNDIRDYTPESTEVKKILKLSQPSASSSPPKYTAKKAAASPTTTTLPPPIIDNRKWCTPVTNQGNLGSCTAQAGVAMYEYMEKKAYGSNGQYIDASRLFLYKTTRYLMGAEGKGDSGAYIRTTLGAIRLFGLPPEEYWGYTDRNPDFDTEPPSALYALGQNYQSVKQFRLDYSKDGEQNIQRMKEYLAKGYALMTGFMVYQSYQQAATNGGLLPYPSQNERIEGGHAILIVGYDDNKTITNQIDGSQTTGAFLIQNSWSDKWGDKGYGWLPYAYYRAGANGDVLADDVWAITQLEWIQSGEFFY